MAQRGAPPAGFSSSALDLHRPAVGERFGRIFHGRFPDPLGFGKSPSRFSDSRRRAPQNRFGVLYLGETLKTCFLEAILRDQRDGRVDDVPIEESVLAVHNHALIEVRQPMTLVDLRGDGPVRMGIPSDVARAARQTLARKWSVALYEHSTRPDGIIYPSRLNGTTNIAIYDRALPKLAAVSITPLIDAPDLPSVLNDLKVAIL